MGEPGRGLRPSDLLTFPEPDRRVLILAVRQRRINAETLVQRCGLTAEAASEVLERLVDQGLLERMDDTTPATYAPAFGGTRP
ncbi:MarR family transcriptional regulator [Methylotetracoccus oryzae]|uniref:MarR family transcriptional regulator n=1 Tax=Methylotetracoccus oryzae TaxID=1919059 RepID=UPI00111A7307|nr:MarR family transcriptional regulator [Methylotetracoccus oryzae]